MNYSDKKFGLAFCNYFLKIELNCDKANHVNFKRILKNGCCLTFWFTHWQHDFLKMVLKKAVFWKICKTCGNMSMTEYTVKEITLCRVATFLELSVPPNIIS